MRVATQREYNRSYERIVNRLLFSTEFGDAIQSVRWHIQRASSRKT